VLRLIQEGRCSVTVVLTFRTRPRTPPRLGAARPRTPASSAIASSVQVKQGVGPVDTDTDPDAAGQHYRVVTASGDLDLATTALLRFDLGGWDPGEGVQHLIVDLGQVAFLDASALGVLCTAAARAELGGGWLRLVYTQHRIALLLDAAHLDARFPRHANLADARAGRTSPQHP
jgi:anti-sigma B factor antagonist